MSLFLGSRERRSNGQTFPEPIIPPFRGVNPYSGAVNLGSNPDAALVVPTVWACVGLISNAVSMLPLQTYRMSANDVPAKEPNSQLLTNPFGDMTQAEWMHMLMVSLLLRGNAIGRIIARDERQVPLQVQLLNPDTVRLGMSDTGVLTYTLTARGVQSEIPTADVWHVRGLTMPGEMVGLSPIAYAAAMLGVDLAARQFAQDFFAGGGIPKAVVSTDQAVNQEQSRTIKERLLAATRNREPIVLGQGLTYKTISVNPDESQFLQTHQMTVTETARFFHVPAGMVGGSEGGSMTYANVEQRSLDFLVHCIQPWLQRLEQAIGALLPGLVYVKFDTRALLRTDAETRAKIDVQHLAGKVVTPSEVRASYDMPPMTPEQQKEADMVPLTVTPLGGAKALPALKAPPGAAAPVPANDPQGVPNASA